MAIIDGQGATFKFNGVLVGGITRFNTVDGTTNDIAHKPVGGDEITYFPDKPEFGSITLYLMRDFQDAGQIALESARAVSLKGEGILTLSDGTAMKFPCYVKRLPIIGEDNGLGTADAVIKIAGKITAA